MKNFKQLLEAGQLSAFKSLYNTARDEYYNNGSTSLTDAEYDALEERIRELAPKWSGLKKTGIAIKTKIGKKVEIELPVPCPSLDKVVAEKPTVVLSWIEKTVAKYGPMLRISEKLDGSSLEAAYFKGRLRMLATRGDGVTGKDITFLAPYLNIPKVIKEQGRLVIRLEAVMPRKVYAKKWAGEYDTARALSSAILNRQDASPALKDLKIVALRVLLPLCSLHEGLDFLETEGFDIAGGSLVHGNSVNIYKLTKAVEFFKANSPYDTDGLVICSNAPNLRTTEERPAYARAFKVNDAASAIQTTIVDIVWQASSFGVLVPKAIISPIKIGGATIKQAAIHNPRWAVDRGIGIGSVVKVLRSGDIIPKIVEVITPAKFKMPDAKKFGTYDWDKKRTSLVLTEAGENKDVLAKRFARFFAKLGLEQMSIGLGKKLVEAGYTETSQAVQMTEHEFRDMGFKSRAAEFAHSMEDVLYGSKDLVTLMAASGCFDRGLGTTRLRTLEEYDWRWLSRWDIQKLDWNEVEEAVAGIPGCGPAFAKMYVAGLPKFWDWVDATGVSWKKPAAKKAAIQGSMTGQMVSWTGYRSHDEEEAVNKKGGVVVPFGSKTTILLYREDGKVSTKVEKARARGIRVGQFSSVMKGFK